MSDKWKNRIVGHGEENPEQLLANPENWRIHPKAQQDAMSGALNQIGWVQSVMVNRTTGNVVDGHMRVALAISRREEAVPVVYVELSKEEEEAVLATFDPIGGLAVSDKEKLGELLDRVDVGDAALVDMLEDVRAKYAEVPTSTPVEFRGDYADTPEDIAAREAARTKGRSMREMVMIMDDQQYAHASSLVGTLRTKWNLTRLIDIVIKALEEAAR